MLLNSDETHGKIFSKSLLDTTLYPHSVKWSNEGLIAVMAKDSVTIYYPSFQPFSLYSGRWIALVKKDTEELHNMTNTKNDNYDFSSLGNWLMNNISDENSLNFKAISWHENLFYADRSSFLSITLTDNSLFLLKRDLSTKGDFDVFTNKPEEFELNGLKLLLNISGTYEEWVESNNFLNSRIFSYDFEYGKITQNSKEFNEMFLVLGGFNMITFWLIKEDIHNDNYPFEMIFLGKFNLSQTVMENKKITTIKFQKPKENEILTEILTLNTYLGLNNGVLVKLVVSFNKNNQIQDINLLWEKKITNTQIDKIIVKNNSLIVLSNGQMCVVPLTSFDEINSRITWCNLHNREFSGISELSLLEKNMENSKITGLITSPQNGLIKLWRIDARDNQTESTEEIISQLNYKLNEKPEEIYGLATDPLGLFIIYMGRAEILQDNSREFQINPALGRPRNILTWETSPILDSLWVSDIVKLSQVLTLVSRESRNCSFSSFSVIYLKGLYTAREVFKYFLVSLTGKTEEMMLHELLEKRKIVKTEGLYVDSGSDNDNDDNDNDDNDDDEYDDGDDDDDIFEKPKKKPKNNKPKKAPQPSKQSKESRINDIEKMHDFLKKCNSLFTLKRKELIALSLPIFFKSLILSVLMIQSDNEENLDSFSNLVNDLSIEEQISLFLEIPFDDSVSLGRKIKLWQLTHLIRESLGEFCSDTFRVFPDIEKAEIIFQSPFHCLKNCIRVGLITNMIRNRFNNENELEKDDFQISDKLSISYMLSFMIFYQNQQVEESIQLQKLCQYLSNYLSNFTGEDNEKCCICEEIIYFDPENPGFSKCVECETVMERCCFTFLLFNTKTSNLQSKNYNQTTRNEKTPKKEDSDKEPKKLGKKLKIYHCPCCQAISNEDLFQTQFSLAGKLIKYDKHNSEKILTYQLFCPFCCVLMEQT